MADPTDPSMKQRISARMSELAKKGHLGVGAYQEVQTYGSIDPFRNEKTAPKLSQNDGSEFMQPGYQDALQIKYDEAMKKRLENANVPPQGVLIEPLE